MKKIKLIILLMLLCLPMVVKADMAAPMTSYKVRVSNINGTIVYKYKYDNNTNEEIKIEENVKYDDVFFVSYENIIDNELFGLGYKVDESGNRLNDDFVYIKLSDTMPLEIKLEDFKKENKLKYYVFDNTNYLYKGPSTIYGKVEPAIALESGMILEVEYYDDMWAYVEYKGVKGWVYRYTFGSKYGSLIETSGMAISSDDYLTNFITTKDVELYSSPKEEKKLGKVIPKNVEIKPKSSYTLIGDEGFIYNYYVEYNGITGWLRTEKGRTIFNKEENSEEATINIAYKYYNGIYGVKNKDGIKLYSDFNDENSVIVIIPYKEKFEVIYQISQPHGTACNMVEYNGIVGWIDANEEFYHYDENGNIKEDVVITNPQQNIIGNVIEEDVDEEVEIEIPEKEEKGINEKIIYYVVGTIVISLTAFVTILLVNKKRKLKNADK